MSWAASLTFSKSPSALYEDAVALAESIGRAGLGTYERAMTRRPLHHVTVPARRESLTTFLQLWDLVGTWRSATIVLAGEPVGERWKARRVLECMARALQFDPPSRYCWSALVAANPAPEADGVVMGDRFLPLISIGAVAAQMPPRLPCRLWASDHWTLQRVDWAAEPARRMDQIRATLLEEGLLRCPLLQLGAFADVLAQWGPGPAPPTR